MRLAEFLIKELSVSESFLISNGLHEISGLHPNSAVYWGIQMAPLFNIETSPPNSPDCMESVESMVSDELIEAIESGKTACDTRVLPPTKSITKKNKNRAKKNTKPGDKVNNPKKPSNKVRNTANKWTVQESDYLRELITECGDEKLHWSHLAERVNKRFNGNKEGRSACMYIPANHIEIYQTNFTM